MEQKTTLVDDDIKAIEKTNTTAFDTEKEFQHKHTACYDSFMTGININRMCILWVFKTRFGGF